MKALLTALLLALQAQPLVGAVACAFGSATVEHECDPQPTNSGIPQVSEPEAGAPHTCYGSIPCAPSSPALPAASVLAVESGDPGADGRVLSPLDISGEALAPPAPPPRT
jgi:hypothetical protein